LRKKCPRDSAEHEISEGNVGKEVFGEPETSKMGGVGAFSNLRNKKRGRPKKALMGVKG